MKIGIDVTPLQNELTGVGNYLLPLLEELILQHPEDTFYLYSIYPITHLKTFSNVLFRSSTLFGFSEALWSQTTLALLCWKEKLDVFWGPTQAFPLLLRCKQKNTITIHDFAYLLYPHTVSTVRGLFLRVFDRAFYRHALCIPNSHGTAHRLKELFNVNAPDVIIPPTKKPFPIQPPFLAHHALQRKEYFLFLGTLEPRKNTLAALDAYLDLLKKRPLPPLVCIGKRGWKEQKILHRFSHSPQVKYLGYVPEEKLSTLIEGAKALVMPSLYEGYGMPLAEARSLQTPVICTAIPEMMEACENDGTFISLSHFKQEFQEALTRTLPSPLACTYPSTASLARKLYSLFLKSD